MTQILIVDGSTTIRRRAQASLAPLLTDEPARPRELDASAREVTVQSLARLVRAVEQWEAGRH